MAEIPVERRVVYGDSAALDFEPGELERGCGVARHDDQGTPVLARRPGSEGCPSEERALDGCVPGVHLLACLAAVDSFAAFAAESRFGHSCIGHRIVAAFDAVVIPDRGMQAPQVQAVLRLVFGDGDI
jgi:hypothetical protein